MTDNIKITDSPAARRQSFGRIRRPKLTPDDRRLARFIRREEKREGWYRDVHQLSEYAVYQMWHRSVRWASLRLNFAARDFGRAVIREFLK